MVQQLETTCALVTGAAGGIGAAIADALEASGHFDEVVRSDLTGAHGCDVAREEDIDKLVSSIAQRGRLTACVHAAGVLLTKPLLETTAADLGRVMEVNTTGAFNVVRRAAALMVEQSTPGAIVTVASNAAGVPRVNFGGYGASKAAASYIARTLGLEVARHGIRVNVLCPGSTMTQMQRDFWGDDPEAGERDVVKGNLETARLGIPLGRIADPADVARTALYLATPASAHVTMQEIYVDGGATLHA
ncbi:SDR family oxidoreductase [Corynebacterium auris]|uniref:SDR family oxidoreductase n=1 Tax=Corynebacterium auris TaxID=44750 RepID=UPI0025B527F9|nr:SDR family oxidoreductase [Corynebacterium auris]WJY68453.1 2,3-dihydro-2,3-dihydroxybenzoate dehydrogenase [Corynebacterium auris]